MTTTPAQPDATGDLTVTPTTPFGAEITGTDLSELGPTPRAELRALLADHQVLFRRDAHLTADGQLALAESLGISLSFASVADPDAGVAPIHTVRGSTVGWHIDASTKLEPPVATVLRAVTVPEVGGDTLWASGVAAYAALPATLQETINDRYVTHGGARASDDGRPPPLVAHPLVQTHPDTGEPYLYINFAAWANPQIIGLSEPDSAELVETLRNIYLHPDRILRFRWTPGAIAIWDNRVVQHTGTHDYDDHPRQMTRACIARFHP